jgi:CubicO group peptidase (beta-lactamase class C family)
MIRGSLRAWRSLAVFVLIVGAAVARLTAQSPAPVLDAKASDPVVMGWMVGAPPPPEKMVRFADGSWFEFPRTRFNGQQIVPAAVVADITKGGDRAKFAPAGYKTLPGWSYRNMWWVSHNPHGAFTARGIHGQGIYVDPAAEMVIARFASHPLAANANYDATSLPAYDAVAKHLMRVAR